ncbi:MAG TPA: hypothetical protein DHU62_04590, partial [Firmicutes bacterium]|nr:hypothetical protein [Bacillota bacterium]
KEVVEVYNNETKELCHIHTENEEIVCTPNHSILTTDGWKLASELTANDMIKTSTGFVQVKSIENEQLKEKISVYNLNVLGYHTYVIGNNLLVVHNECRATQRKKYWKNEANVQNGAGKTYQANSQNIARMKTGKAPIGFDKNPVELHHVKGIKNDFNSIVQIQRSDHINFHKLYKYKDFVDITTLEEFISLIV